MYFVKQLAVPTLRKEPLPVPFPALKIPAVGRYQSTKRHNHEVSIRSHRRYNLPSPYSNTRCTTATEPPQTAHCDTVQLLLQSGLHFTYLPYTCGRHVPEGCQCAAGRTDSHTLTQNKCYNISFCFRAAKERLRGYFRFSNRKFPRRSEFPLDGQHQQSQSTDRHAADAYGISIAEPSVEPKFHYQQDLTSS